MPPDGEQSVILSTLGSSGRSDRAAEMARKALQSSEIGATARFVVCIMTGGWIPKRAPLLGQHSFTNHASPDRPGSRIAGSTPSLGARTQLASPTPRVPHRREPQGEPPRAGELTLWPAALGLSRASQLS